jgi:hypothetical protein
MKENNKGTRTGSKNHVHHESKLIRVPIELAEPIEMMVKVYRNQRTFLLQKLRESNELRS